MAKGGRVGPGKQFITLYLNKETVKRLDDLAAAKNTSRSRFCEQLILDGLQDSELTVRAMTTPVVRDALFSVLAKPDVLRAIMRGMQDELSDDQLELFSRAMIGASQAVEKADPQSPGQRASNSARSKPRRSSGGKQGQGQGRG